MSRRHAEVKLAPPVAQATPQPDLAARQRDAAEYLSDMILELRNLARAVRLHRVMVPLEFAYYEAFGAANRVEVPPAELERLKALGKAAEAYEAEGPGAAGR